jgi:hypothetical protein
MRTTNEGVVSAWKQGLIGWNSRKTLHTDGRYLYSYRLRIGTRLNGGATVVGDFTAPGGEYKSQTTSCHVGLAKRSGVDMVMHALVWRTSPVSYKDVYRPLELDLATGKVSRVPLEEVA